MIKFSKRCLLPLICMLYCVNAIGQTYYYERVTDDVKKDGHYITFGNSNCYDSDKNGCSKSNGVINYVGEVNGKHKYRGDGYFGTSVYLFSSDYSFLELRCVSNNVVYKYKRLYAPSNKTTAVRGYVEPNSSNGNNGSTGVIYVPSMPVTSSQPTYVPTSPEPRTWHRCSSCAGTGLCSGCRGTGLNAYTKSGNCGVCYGSGRCPGCRGAGGSKY